MADRGLEVTDLDRLLELAEKATPGPWEAELSTAVGGYIVKDGDIIILAPERKADAEYIAALSPDVVRGLIERVKEAEREDKWATVKRLSDALAEAETKLAIADATLEKQSRVFKARLRAAEEVVEVLKRVEKVLGVPVEVADALRHYAEVAKG